MRPDPIGDAPPETSSVNMPAQIVQQVRVMIAQGILAPGVHLGQSELAAQFNASRVPVRVTDRVRSQGRLSGA